MLWWTLQQLKSSNPESRKKAAQNLGAARQKKGVSSLINALQDQDPEVRLAVIEALGSIAHPASAEPLAAALISAPANNKSGVSAECASLSAALASIGSPAVKPLLKALASEDKESRRCAASALGLIRDPEAVDPLIKRLDDSRSEVRKAAAVALGEIADPRGLKPLIRALSNRDFETRRSAAEALGRLKSVEAVDHLFAAVSDQNEQVQVAAIMALASIGGLPAARCLRSAAGSPRKAVCEAAEAALKNMSFSPAGREERAELAVIRGDFEGAAREGTAAVPALIRSLSFKDFQMRVKAIEVLAEFRVPESVASLLDSLKDHNTAVQEAAARALTGIGTPAIPALQSALAHYDSSVVRLSAEALGRIGKPVSVAALANLIAANSRVPGEYPELFDAVRAAIDSLSGIVAACSPEISLPDLKKISELPDVHLLGQSPKVLDCASLRTLAANELSQRQKESRDCLPAAED